MNPTDLDALMERLGRQRFVIHMFGNDDRHGPVMLAATHDWGDVADAVIVEDDRRASAHRTPVVDTNGRDIDVLEPPSVYWHYFGIGGPLWAVHMLLEVPQPAHLDAPRSLYVPPELCRIPKDLRRTARMRMRPQR